jgi:XTP/dITP diphosphohydrolase
MTKQDLYFVTSNSKKFESLNKMLSPIGVTLLRLEYDFDEGRELSIEAVAKSKLDQAKQAFPGKKIVVDDRGFFIPALKGFPGPFVKLLLDSFSYKGLTKLMAGESDRRAFFSYAIGYFDGRADHVLVADEEGFITDEPRGDNLHGWTELLYVYGHPSYPGRSLAELTDAEWDDYLEQINDIDPFALLKNHLITQAEI